MFATDLGLNRLGTEISANPTLSMLCLTLNTLKPQLERDEQAELEHHIRAEVGVIALHVIIFTEIIFIYDTGEGDTWQDS
jgi:hypothetical protein